MFKMSQYMVNVQNEPIYGKWLNFVEVSTIKMADCLGEPR